MSIKWTQALKDAVAQIASVPAETDLDYDIRSRALEYRDVPVGYELQPHQVSYTHCLLQRLDTYNERPSHAAFKKAWEDAQPSN